MSAELELKAVVDDPAALRQRLRAAQAEPVFEGIMRDRRYDRDGALAARDEVLRIRTFEASAAQPRSVLGWKGPVSRTPEGYKQREEHECECTGDSPAIVLGKLGFAVVHQMDRWVEQFTLAGATVRLETYPTMDVLVEIEGEGAGIESAIRLSGIPRDRFSADPLAEFVRRFEQRTGVAAVLSASNLPAERKVPWHA